MQRQKVDADRISELHDEILIHILSLLRLEEAVRTSVLARRWRFLWTYLSSLRPPQQTMKLMLPHYVSEDREIVEYINRYYQIFQIHQEKYINMYNQILQMHRADTLDEFKVFFELNADHKDHLDRWIAHVLCKKVNRIDIDLRHCPHHDKWYQFSYECFTLVQNPHCGVSSVKALKFLCLGNFSFSAPLIENFLLNFPLLENVVLFGSFDLMDLKVVGSSLRLNFLEIYACSNLRIIEISAPNLVTFNCDFRNDTRVDIKHAPKLANVCIHGWNIEILSQGFISLSSHLSQLETLRLDAFYMEFFCLPKLPELTSLRHLMISVNPCWKIENLFCFTPLIKASPFLQKVTMQLRGRPNVNREHLKHPSFTHQHLKVIEFDGFTGSVLDIEFAHHLLEIAVALEEVIVTPFKIPKHSRKANADLEEEMAVKQAREEGMKLKEKLPPGAKL
ncbi:hypothetical protein RJ641_002432, partial [Dillenia turbinata]